MARAAELERLIAVQGLLASLDVRAGVLRVIDVDRDVDLDAADGVDDGDELVEVNLRIVGDGNARELGDGLDGVGRAGDVLLA